MRTLIFLGICAACVGIAIAECRDRSDRRKVVTHGAVGLVAGYVIWKLIVWAGAFDNW